MENSIIHKAETRGFADLGWLKSYHTFSFSGYYNPDRMHFGALRVLNDDVVDGSRGFGEHPHDNMEIISIPLEGELVHKDNMGNQAVIRSGEIQVMSAGTGIYHSEYNKDSSAPVKFLQIWIYPNQQNVSPRYQQAEINMSERNVLHQILSPDKDDAGVWIYQQAWFHMGKFDKGAETTYQLKNKVSGVYALIIKGDVTINNEELNNRDGIGIWNTEILHIKASSDAHILLMEVPITY